MRNVTKVLYEDEYMIVCHKEAGLPVQTDKSSTTDLVSFLRNYRADHNEATEIFLVHRLDQPVEGIIVCAKTKSAAAGLSMQFAGKRVEKTYLAVIESKLQHTSGIIESYLKRDGKTNTSRVVAKGTNGAKFARLNYRAVMFDGTKSLLEIQLDTGRHHQIRVQLAELGCSVYGDRKYGNMANEREQGISYEPLALSSYKIKLFHPKTKKEMNFTSFPKGDIFQSFRISYET